MIEAASGEIIAEEQAGFRAGGSTTEQISNLRILYGKDLQHQQNIYYVFIEFRMAFDRVWHAGRSTTSVPTLSKSSKTSITRPLVQSSSTSE